MKIEVSVHDLQMQMAKLIKQASQIKGEKKVFANVTENGIELELFVKADSLEQKLQKMLAAAQARK